MSRGRTAFLSLGAFGVATAATLTVLLWVLLGMEAIPFFKDVGFFHFLFGLEWSPGIEPKSFGVLPLVAGTFWVVAIALLISVPVAFLISVHVSFYASPRIARISRSLFDLLGGIPSVVFGFLGLMLVTPALRLFLPDTEYFNALSGGIVVAIMCLPLLVSLMVEAFRSLAPELRSSGFALGAGEYRVLFGILVPELKSPMMAAILLALARAAGETMAVALAVGSQAQLTLDPTKGMQTMTAYIAQISFGDTAAQSPEYRSLFAIALLLYAATFTLNCVSRSVLARWGRRTL